MKYRTRRLTTLLMPLTASCFSMFLPSTSQAAILTTGSVGSNPGGALIGPGNTVLPGTTLYVGNSAPGTLQVDGGSFLQVARLGFASGGTGTANGLITGAGTVVELVGQGSGAQTQRLLVSDWGNAQLTVSNGALLKSAQTSECLIQFHYCDSFVGSAAGDVATMTVTGAGTRADIANALFIGHPGFVTPAAGGYSYGVAGATVQANVNVLAGAELRTDRAQVGTRQWDAASTGFEKSVSNVTVAGTGSVWRVTGGQGWDAVTGAITTFSPGISTGLDRYAVANIEVRDGGELRIEGIAGQLSFLNLSGGGGRTDMAVRGVGSALNFTGEAGYLQVGRSLGSATLNVTEGGTVGGVFYALVGRDGSFGEMVIDGVGSRVRLDATAPAAAPALLQTARFDIGNNGTGKVTVSNGGKLEVLAPAAASASPVQLTLGQSAASSGSLDVNGSGSVVQLSAPSAVPGGGPTEAFNPLVRVGRQGSGQLNVTAGGKLLIDGQAVSTLADSRGTNLYIGGSSDSAVGGRGIATVSGPGSEIRLSGSDTFIAVGIGPGSSGQLTVNNLAVVAATGMNVGRSEGTGVLRVDNASLMFEGQHTGSNQSGAFLAIGRSGGIGVADVSRGSTISLVNMGSAGASLSLGGTSAGPLGDGSLTVSGASKIRLQAAPGLANVIVGRDGSGLLRVKGGSSIDVGDGNFYVARLPGSDGTVVATEASSITAGWVGIGRNKTSTGSVDGGTGTMVLNGATLTAETVVIGSNGFLGGTAGAIHAGNVINYGIFSPGNSPGSFSIDADFTAGTGSRLILEVQSDGLGGFVTDHVFFKSGAALNLAAMNVEFRFLGGTNPNAFLASGGFDIDTFLATRNAAGGSDPLPDAAFNGVSFSAQADGYAITNFSYSASAGAIFSAVPVPEPSSWALMLAGSVMLWKRLASSARAAKARGEHLPSPTP